MPYIADSEKLQGLGRREGKKSSWKEVEGVGKNQRGSSGCAEAGQRLKRAGIV